MTGALVSVQIAGGDIHERDELITYRRSDDSIGVFAECPSCDAVVDPGEP